MALIQAENYIEHLLQQSRVKHLLIALAVVVACAFAFEWLQEHDARLHAEANASIQQAKIDAAEKSIKDRNKELVDVLKPLKQTAASVSTPQQAVAKQDTLDLHLPAPVVQFDAAKPQEIKSGDLVVPQSDIVPIFKHLNQCQQDQASLGACSKNYADMVADRDGWKLKSDTWEKAAKGGSKLHRTLSTLEHVGIGIGIGYAVGAVHH